MVNYLKNKIGKWKIRASYFLRQLVDDCTENESLSALVENHTTVTTPTLLDGSGYKR